MSVQKKHVIIVGAGIVGVSTAIWLQRDGHDVTLVDKVGPAGGTSYGNAGLLASASIVPVTAPGLLKKVPKMLFNPDQPLFLRWSYLPKLMPFLFKYLAHANAEDAKRISDALYDIVGDSVADHQALAAGTGAERWIVPQEYVFAYSDKAAYDGDAFGWSIRRDRGFVCEELDEAALRAQEPALSGDFRYGVRIPNHGRITDPGAYVKALAAHVVAEGGRIVEAEVNDIVRENGRATGVRAGGETISGDAVVVALGAWSGKLCKQLGLEVPLESERGYHLEFWEPSVMPKTPVMITTGKFLLTPMEGRLRAAGVVEFGGLEAPPSEAPFALLRKAVRKAVPGLTFKEETTWMGHRPATTDSIPVIGEAPGVPGAFLGFGHQHVGLTGGPKTGRILAQLIGGKTPNMDLTRYSPSRFGA
ncbi:NAD(P)/FAD-dependent oxidoreductase [Nisaea sediminum]|uniref:NAD(P)/FAD-dependent oxidoreductase n=1 Tax=Nisaea sediminum TaxID=2775867 RepID=UPI0018666365|nr:FAD-binding oxidoreductase [Nisaea sediminum]